MFKNVRKENLPYCYAGIIIGGFVIFIMIANIWLGLKVEEIVKSPIKQIKQAIIAKKMEREFKRRKIYDNVVRRQLLEPNRKYYLNIIYNKGREIARYKSIDEKMIDWNGTVPDGRVIFFNETMNTHGEERYHRNKRNGSLVEYYENGRTKREARYIRGKMLRNTVYYFDGKVRKFEDYTDALALSDDPEAGEGKIYHRDGELMYEWSITNRGRGGYKKSYNHEGTLVETKLYDDSGELVEVINYRVR